MEHPMEHDARSSGVASSAPASEVGSLTGAELDAAVARVLGHKFSVTDGMVTVYDWQRPGSLVRGNPFMPSTSWAQAGPIIERERITIRPVDPGGMFDGELQREPHWLAAPWGGLNEIGDTPIIAAMRAFVASKRAP